MVVFGIVVGVTAAAAAVSFTVVLDLDVTVRAVVVVWDSVRIRVRIRVRVRIAAVLAATLIINAGAMQSMVFVFQLSCPLLFDKSLFLFVKSLLLFCDRHPPPISQPMHIKCSLPGCGGILGLGKCHCSCRYFRARLFRWAAIESVGILRSVTVVVVVVVVVVDVVVVDVDVVVVTFFIVFVPRREFRAVPAIPSLFRTWSFARCTQAIEAVLPALPFLGLAGGVLPRAVLRLVLEDSRKGLPGCVRGRSGRRRFYQCRERRRWGIVAGMVVSR
mmetsp:Transcript_407/g.1039  ORF Transcript_407/g.1039 Transcript_407/m.1039 type:complete len:274 (+) Transcript_407:4033-4854(+)